MKYGGFFKALHSRAKSFLNSNFKFINKIYFVKNTALAILCTFNHRKNENVYLVKSKKLLHKIFGPILLQQDVEFRAS